MDADFLLIHKMKNGDEEAIEVFVKKYYSTIRNYCRLHTYTDCDAEDCKFCSNGTPILKSSVHSF